MNNLIYFEKQDSETTSFTERGLQELIEGRIESNLKYDDLMDKTLIGDKFFFVMLTEQLPEQYGREPRFSNDVIRVRKSQLDEKLAGFKFDRETAIGIPIFEKK